MAAPSGFTKVVLKINNGRYGRSEAHVFKGSLNDTATAAKALELAQQRAYLLGNEKISGVLAQKKSLATPRIEYISLTDALVPRLGRLLDLTNTNPPLVGLYDLPADHFSTVIALRLIAEDPDANRQFNVTLQIGGQPDDGVQAGVLQPSLPMGGSTLGQKWADYMAYLTAGAQNTAKWGTMGLSLTETPHGIDSWTLTNGVWIATTHEAHGYTTGDRVRITRANPVFNGTWRVIVITATSFALKKQPVSGHTPPSTGLAYRVGKADGSRLLTFYPYKDSQKGIGNNVQAKVSKKNPGKEFVGVSFQHRVRRER